MRLALRDQGMIGHVCLISTGELKSISVSAFQFIVQEVSGGGEGLHSTIGIFSTTGRFLACLLVENYGQ